MYYVESCQQLSKISFVVKEKSVLDKTKKKAKKKKQPNPTLFSYIAPIWIYSFFKISFSINHFSAVEGSPCHIFVMVMACEETSDGSARWGMVRGLGIWLQTFAERKRLCFLLTLAPASPDPSTALSCPTTASCTSGHSWNVLTICVSQAEKGWKMDSSKLTCSYQC